MLIWQDKMDAAGVALVLIGPGSVDQVYNDLVQFLGSWAYISITGSWENGIFFCIHQYSNFSFYPTSCS